MDWKQELFKRLDAIAEKLGTTAGYLWHVLVKQGIATGAADACVAVTFGILSIVAVKMARKWWKAGEEHDDKDYLLGACVASWAAFLAFTIVAIVFSYDAIRELINPEFYALKQILDSLK